MSDASITAAAVICIPKLIDRVQHSNDPDARELADRVAQAIKQPDRRVGAALLPKKRGGRAPPLLERIQERDRAICELTELQPGKTRNARIQAARSKQARYAAAGWPHERNAPASTGNRERDLLLEIMKTGLPIPGERQHRAIMRARTKK